MEPGRARFRAPEVAAVRFRLRLDDSLHDVHVVQESGTTWVEVAGRRLRVTAARRGEAWDVTLDGTKHRVAVERHAVVLDGERLEGEVSHLRLTRPGEENAEPAAGVRETRAPMPGRVARVDVAPGTAVRRGQTLVILEAMKMQNEIASPADGRVKEVRVSGGEMVESGQVLVVLE